MRQLISMVTGLLVVGLLCVPQLAMADLDEVLGDVEWGDDRDEVLEKLRAQNIDELREDRSLRNDHSAMQRARQQVLDRMRRIEDSYTSLEGERTDFDVSVVAGEFTPNNDESMFRVRDRVAQRYYFFVDGEFYKLVVAYDPDHIEGVGFPGFVNETQREYGEPTSMTPGTRAVWRTGDSEMRVDDKRDYFGTFTMTFVDRQRVERLEDEGRVFGGRHEDDEEQGVSARVQAVTGPSDGASNEGVVDDLVGSETERVEFSSGDDEEEDEEQASSEPAEPAEPSETADSSDEPAPAPAPQPTRDTSDDEDDDDDGGGLMIY